MTPITRRYLTDIGRPRNGRHAVPGPLPGDLMCSDWQETDIQWRLRPVPTVVTVTVALGLVFLGVIRVFEPSLSGNAFLVGVYLIAVTAAVCLNAFTIPAMTRPL
jgi:hypothetical protein